MAEFCRSKKDLYLKFLAAMLTGVILVTGSLYVWFSGMISYAAEVGDAVTSEAQFSAGDTKYPADNATIVSITQSSEKKPKYTLYSDGTCVITDGTYSSTVSSTVTSDMVSNARTVIVDTEYKLSLNFKTETIYITSNATHYTTSAYCYADHIYFAEDVNNVPDLAFTNLKKNDGTDKLNIYFLSKTGVFTIGKGSFNTSNYINLFINSNFTFTVNNVSGQYSFPFFVQADIYCPAIYVQGIADKFDKLMAYTSTAGRYCTFHTRASDYMYENPDGDSIPVSLLNENALYVDSYVGEDTAYLSYPNVRYDLSGMDLDDLITDTGATKLASYAFKNHILPADIVVNPAIAEVGREAFSSNSGLETLRLNESIKTISSDALLNNTTISTLYYNADAKFELNLADCSNLEKIYILSSMSSGYDKANLPAMAMVYCEEGSLVENWCINNSVAYTSMTAEEIAGILNGELPTMRAESFLFDAEDAGDISITVDLGRKPAGADGISKVLIDSVTLKAADYEFLGSDTVVIKFDYLKTLANGMHTISVRFDNGTFRSGASVMIANSDVPDSNTQPPTALDTIKYEFYKDYPDYVIIPVTLNGATSITSLRIGSNTLDSEDYELQDAAIIINYDFLETLDPGKYRVLPTFNDPGKTTISNLQLIVYNQAADRAAPYLLQSRILFTGSPVTLNFDPGAGELFTTNVLALVIDDQLILPNGDVSPFTSGKVATLKKEAKTDFELELEEATPSEAEKNEAINEPMEEPEPDIPNIATSSTALKAFGSFISIPEQAVPLDSKVAFSVSDTSIIVSGEYIESLHLSVGDHLIGAIFENTERTTDVKKVILTISKTDDNDGEDPDPVTPNEPSDGEDDDSGENPSEPGSGGSNGSNGGSGSGGSSGGSGGSKAPSNSTPPTNDSTAKPAVPDTGGSFTVNPDNPYDVTYTMPDGSLASNEWVGDGEDWFHVNANGKVDYDWFLDAGPDKWYMLNREPNGKLGAAKYGWYFESRDNKWYYLNSKTTAMLTGWQSINNIWYYLTAFNEGPTYFGNNYEGWSYDPTKPGRPLGSMYADESTPDGYRVDGNGAWIN
ncbi:leucine-rich repeat protein [Lachnospiraceae bacterium 54-53]